MARRRTLLPPLLAAALGLSGLVAAAPDAGAAPDAAKPPATSDVIKDVANTKRTTLLSRLATQRSAPAIAAEEAGDPIGTVKTWAALDDFENAEYLKDYQLRGVGQHIEVWVADDSDDISSGIQFQAGDCRNDERVQLTDEQIQSLIAEYDGNILPKESAAFSVAPDRDGSNAILAEAIGAPADYWKGDGDNVVVLVDNVRDKNFYDLSLANGDVTYIAGFFYSNFNEYFDRNVMTIDAYDWLHRTGANPPDEPVEGDLCASKPAKPFTYESTFAHEYQHLLESYEDPAEYSWVNEGLSMYAEVVTGYATPDIPITQVGTDAYIQCLLGNSETVTPANPNPRPGGPENSLTVWGDQGPDSEILCDYGAAYSMMLYLDGRFGDAFLSALHDDDRQGLASLDALLAEFNTHEDAFEVLHHWAASLALDVPLEGDAYFLGGWRKGHSIPALHAAINWDNDDAYSTPGAPPNGSDYVRLRRNDGRWFDGSEITAITFDGDTTLPTSPTEWTVDPEARPGDAALYSGSGPNFDRAAITAVTVPTDDPTLRFSTSWETEAGWDFAFVQVSTDGGSTWTSLANDDTTAEHDPGAIPGVVANLPGFTDTSGGWVDEAFDLSAYAGQDVLIAFRYITDPGVDLPGWWIDDVSVGATTISDGSSLEGFRSASEVSPTPISGYTVQIVGYSSDGDGPVFTIPLPLGPHNNGAIYKGHGLPRKLLATADVVAAIVTYDDPTETVTQYAPYTLRVNAAVQPGGRAEA